jgi:DNA-directed RNA polymerase specialized sigma24 family protein
MHTEEWARVEEAVRDLPARQAEALETYRQDRDRPTIAELARLWNCKEGHVYYVRSQARKAVRARLGVREEDRDEN